MKDKFEIILKNEVCQISIYSIIFYYRVLIIKQPLMFLFTIYIKEISFSVLSILDKVKNEAKVVAVK